VGDVRATNALWKSVAIDLQKEGMGPMQPSAGFTENGQAAPGWVTF
jgi:hypothetical protein